MYDFILNMWVMKRIDSAKVQSYATKGYVTQTEADMILGTPQVI